MAKAKGLTPIPKATKAKPAATRNVASAEPEQSKGPDLSHIAPELRPLARPLADIAFLASNIYSHPEDQIDKLKQVLTQRGQIEPLVVNKRTTPPQVLGGNGRLAAMLSLGWTHAAYHFIDVDAAEAEAIAFELNGASDGRVLVPEKLTAMLERIKTAKVELSPRIGEMLEALRAKQAKVVAPPAVGPKTTSQETTKPPVTCPACNHQWHP